MSKQDKINKLKEYIKNLVVQELKRDDELDEVSTTATAGIDGTGTGHYDTPRAFASGSQGGHPNPEVVGYKKVNEGRYHDWRNDESLTPKQKVGRSIREIRDALNELDKTVKMNLKLKTELNMNSKDYWKNTHKALTKISERLVKMANKIGNLK
jgi:hypothetical protein